MQHNFAIPNKPLDSTKFRNDTGFDLYIRDGELVISGELTKAQATTALDAHNPPDPAIALAAAAAAKASGVAKLAALGFTEAEIAAW